MTSLYLVFSLRNIGSFRVNLILIDSGVMLVCLYSWILLMFRLLNFTATDEVGMAKNCRFNLLLHGNIIPI